MIDEMCFDNPGEWQQLTCEELVHGVKVKSRIWLDKCLAVSFTGKPSWWRRLLVRWLLGWRWEVIGDDR